MRPVCILLFLGLLVFPGCKPAEFTIDNYSGKRIIVGNGGGFTGQIIEYTIFENGQVFRKNSMNNSIEERKTLDKNTTSQLFSNYNTLSLNEIEYNRPGNMYYFLQLIDGQKSHTITWGADQKEKLNSKVKLLYNIIMKKIRE